MAIRLEHTSLRSGDLERSIAFYTELLGMTFVRRKEIPQWNVELAFLESEGGNLLEIMWYKDQQEFVVPDPRKAIFDHVAFDVDDLPQVLERCRARGVTILEEPFSFTPGGSTLAFIEDPDGTRIELLQRAK